MKTLPPIRHAFVFAVLLIACTGGSDEEPAVSLDASAEETDANSPAHADAAPLPLPPDAGPTCLNVVFPPASPATLNSCSREMQTCYATTTSNADVAECLAVEAAECETCFWDEIMHCFGLGCHAQSIDLECCLQETCPGGDADCASVARGGGGSCSVESAAWHDCTGAQSDCFQVPDICVEICDPLSCASEGFTCGTLSDGCGALLNCGSCQGSDTCGGGGLNNQCGCTPLVCGDACGTMNDGCGGTLACGGCSATDTCGGSGIANQCGCTPTSCATEGMTCGTTSDHCGGTLDCGACFDYEVTQVSTPNSTAKFGQAITLTATVRNNGIDASPATTVRFVYSSNSLIGVSDTATCTRSVPALSPGASTNVSSACAVPALNSGSYFLGAIVDPLKSSAETDESNNSAAGNTIAITGPNIDLEYRLFYDNGSYTKHPGDVVTYTLEVANLGSDAVPAFEVSVHYSLDMNITAFDPLVCTKTLVGFPGNTIATIPFTCTIPNIAPGYYFKGIRIDPNNDIAESDESNNVSDVAFSEPIQP